MRWHSDSRVALVLAAHTDDGELGCGATMSKLIRSGYEVHHFAFCSCDSTLPDGLPSGTLEEEFRMASKTLAVPSHNLKVFDFEVRRLAESRQQVLEILVETNRNLEPDIVFCATPGDLHQDHQTLAIEAIRAFKNRTILCYEMPWNNITFSANFLVSVGRDDLDNKVNSLSKYRSQSHRRYMDPLFAEGLARVRGATIGVEFAEAFTMVRGVWED